MPLTFAALDFVGVTSAVLMSLGGGRAAGTGRLATVSDAEARVRQAVQTLLSAIRDRDGDEACGVMAPAAQADTVRAARDKGHDADTCSAAFESLWGEAGSLGEEFARLQIVRVEIDGDVARVPIRHPVWNGADHFVLHRVGTQWLFVEHVEQLED
jgi:hypothetical protein